MTHHRDDLPDDALDRRLDAVLRDLHGSWNVPPTPPLDAMWERIEETLDAPGSKLDVRRSTLTLHAPRTAPPWRRRAARMAALAATLLAGVAIGRLTVRPEPAALVAEATDPKKPKVAPKGLERARPVVVEAERPPAPDAPRGAGLGPRPSVAALVALTTPDSRRPAPALAEGRGPRAEGDSTQLDAAEGSTSTRYLGQATALLIALSTEAPRPGEDARLSRRAGSLLVTTRLLLDAPATDAATRELLEDLELVLTQVVRLQTAAGREELQLIREALEQRDLLPRLHTAAMHGAED